MNAHVGPSQALNIRGRSLLAFVLEPVEPLSGWLTSLDNWLARSPAFFVGKPVVLDLSALDLDLKAYRAFLNELARRHIRVMGVENARQTLVGPHLPPIVTGAKTVSAAALMEDEAPSDRAQAETEAPAQARADKAPPAESPETLVVDGNIRSGQSVVHANGDVVVIGRVASGAEIVAGGSVHVYGRLEGRVIAGISGSPSARIFCREARAELLCIGGVYVTAEDADPKTEGRSVEARLDGEELRLRILD